MGQVSVPSAAPALILSSLDRLVASNADGGLSPAASHIVLLGENAGQNLGPLSYIYVIGASALDAGITKTQQDGTIVIGGLSLSALTNATAPTSADGPIIALGYNIAPALVNRMGASQFIGDNILANYPAAGLESSANVYIGSEIMANNRDLAANHGASVGSFNVIMGWRAARMQAIATSGGGTSVTSCVIIGAEIGANGGFDGPVPGTTVSTSVLIGRGVCAGMVNQQNAALASTVAIGNQCVSGVVSGGTNVFIGSGVSAPTLDSVDNIYIGANVNGVTSNASTGNILIGASIILQGARDRCIIIGTRANSANNMPADDSLLIETSDGGTIRTILFGRLSAASPGPGGLVVGHSVEGTNRDLPGFNILKLVNGTRDGGLTAPIGGGYFYSVAGELHWVSTGNVDYALTPGGGLGTFAVAALPAAPPAGSRAFANNALAPAFLAAVAGGGAVFTPVFFNGAAWIVG